MSEGSSYRIPEHLYRADGEMRRVGFELEFSGLTLDAAARAVAAGVGGEHHRDSSAEHTVTAADLGDFHIEVDWEFLKKQARAAADHGAEVSSGGWDWTETASELATLIVPVEVVCPPIAITELDRLQSMTDALRDAGATGTGESPLAAYGVHLNPEIPSLDAATLHRYLRAFSLLQWWLVREHEVDPTRRLTFYVDPYPEAYLHEVHELQDPDLNTLLEHYLAHNATRNRALDMLPLFSMVDEVRVQAATKDARIKARPTFHYRLPNCHIEQPDWSLAQPWNRWCVVEALAANAQALDTLSARFNDRRRPLLGVARDKWLKDLDVWIEKHV